MQRIAFVGVLSMCVVFVYRLRRTPPKPKVLSSSVFMLISLEDSKTLEEVARESEGIHEDST